MTVILRIGKEGLNASALIEKLRQYQLMPKLVQEMVIDQAIDDIECDSQVAMQTYCASRGIFSQEQQQVWCQQQKIDPGQMMTAAIREFRLAKFQAEKWGGASLESYFLQRKTQLDRVRYSLIRTKNASLAQEVYFRLSDDGAAFADLAREYSEGQEAKTGGLIGPVELSVPHPVLARMLMVSQPGQLWAPTQIGEWMVIARLDQFLPAQMDDAMRQRLLSEKFQAWVQQQIQDTAVRGPDEELTISM